mgnify:FL=1
MKYPTSLKIKAFVYIVFCLLTAVLFYLGIASGSNGYVLISSIRFVESIIIYLVAKIIRFNILDCIEDLDD